MKETVHSGLNSIEESKKDGFSAYMGAEAGIVISQNKEKKYQDFCVLVVECISNKSSYLITPRTIDMKFEDETIFRINADDMGTSGVIKDDLRYQNCYFNIDMSSRLYLLLSTKSIKYLIIKDNRSNKEIKCNRLYEDIFKEQIHCLLLKSTK